MGCGTLCPGELFYPRSPCGERRRALHGVLRAVDFSIHALLAESDLESLEAFRLRLLFLSTLSLRRATQSDAPASPYRVFSIHALLAESDQLRQHALGRREFSIHALLAESDRSSVVAVKIIFLFYPRSPCGERRRCRSSVMCSIKFFYPRSPCGERLAEARKKYPEWYFSIHALLAESDPQNRYSFKPSYLFLSTLSLRRATCSRQLHLPKQRFSIHALLAESDVYMPLVYMRGYHFLSTLSLRRATEHAYQLVLWVLRFLSTLSLRRATPVCYAGNCTADFLSTLSLRRATLAGPSGPAFLYIFYPRSPCGERQPAAARNDKNNVFLSTLSLRRATNINSSVNTADKFSIHALLAESDSMTHTQKFCA